MAKKRLKEVHVVVYQKDGKQIFEGFISKYAAKVRKGKLIDNGMLNVASAVVPVMDNNVEVHG